MLSLDNIYVEPESDFTLYFVININKLTGETEIQVMYRNKLLNWLHGHPDSKMVRFDSRCIQKMCGWSYDDVLIIKGNEVSFRKHTKVTFTLEED